MDDYRRPPSTQSGFTADLDAQHVQETVAPQGLEPNIVGPDRTPSSTPVAAPSGDGAPNIGAPIDGWHPGK